MFTNSVANAPIIVEVSTTSKIKSLLSKFLGVALHFSILFVGTEIAAYAWRYWGGHY